MSAPAVRRGPGGQRKPKNSPFGNRTTPTPSIAADVTKSTFAGLAKGAIGIPGAPADIIGLLKHVGNWINAKQVEYGLVSPEAIERYMERMFADVSLL
jgi:hypothetical protein